MRKLSSCFGAEKSEFPDIPENWWSKRKNKGKKEANKKTNNRKEVLKLMFRKFSPK